MLSSAVKALAGASRKAAARAASERSFAQAAASSGKVLSSLVVERLPIVTPELEPWEKEYMTWQKSLQSKYKILPQEFTEVEKPVADDGEAEEDPWQPGSRLTAADKSGDVRTTNRKLDRRLFLLVRNKKLGVWEFPTTEHQEGETIRGTAERNFKTAVGDAKCYFVGNAPMAHYRQTAGDTQFFNKVQIMQPSVSLQPGSGADDQIWVTAEEVAEYIQDEGLRMLSKRMLSK